MNCVDRRYKILYRTVSLPNVVGAPPIRRWKIPVDFLQFQIESITELPEGVIYVNDSCFAHGRLFSVLRAWLSEGKEQLNSTGTDDQLSRLCAFQGDDEFSGCVGFR